MRGLLSRQPRVKLPPEMRPYEARWVLARHEYIKSRSRNPLDMIRMIRRFGGGKLGVPLSTLVPLASTAASPMTDQTGNVLANRSVFIYTPNTTTQVQVYTAGGATMVQPLLTDTLGYVPGYVYAEQVIDVFDSVTQTRKSGIQVLSAADVEMLLSYIATVGGALPLYQNPIVNGADPTGVTDSTAAINTTLSNGTSFLTAGTYKILGNVVVPSGSDLLGAGSDAVTMVLGASGKVTYGPALGTIPSQHTGHSGGWTINGNNVAGTSNPLLLVNVSGHTFVDTVVESGLGDGVIFGGQNCVFINLNTGGHKGCSLAFDNGCGGAVFIKPELSYGALYHVEFRETVAPPPGAYPVPSNNYLYGGICEGGDPLNVGCVHHLAGNTNRFKDFNFFSGGSAVQLVYAEPNTAAGRGSDANELMFYEDCFFTGSNLHAIACSSTYAPIVGVSGDGIILQGYNIFSAFTDAIYWPGSMPVWDEGQMKCYGVTNPFTSTGTPLRRPRSRKQGQPGIRVPTESGWVPLGRPVAANFAYFTRFIASEDVLVTALAFEVLVAAGSNDTVAVGIYNEYNAKVASTALTASKLNVVGRQSVSFASPVSVLAGWVYYAMVATAAIGTTPAQLAMANFGNANNGFGAAPGTAECVLLGPNSGGGAPAAMAAGGGAALTEPDAGGSVCWLIEAGTIGQ